MKAKLAVATALFGMLAVSPALANGFFCGGKDYNQCSVSPTTKRDCVKDLVHDIKDFKCDLLELLKDIAFHKSRMEVRKDVKELIEDQREIEFDLAVLAALGKK